MSEIEVKPGQVWADNDPRCAGRTMRVERVQFSPRMGCDVAICTILTNADSQQRLLDDPPSWSNARDMRGYETRISVRRMRPNSTGYRLLSEPAGESL